MESKIRKIFNPQEYAHLWAKYYENQAKNTGYGDLGVYRNPDGIRVLASASKTVPNKKIKKVTKKTTKIKKKVTKKPKVINRKAVKQGDIFKKVKIR